MSNALLLQITVPKLQLSDVECEWFRFDEEVSRPFRLEAVFIESASYVDKAADVVGSAASFMVQANGQGRKVGGIVWEFRIIDVLEDGQCVYGVVLLPRLALLGRTRRNEIFATDTPLTVYDLVTGLLGGTLSKNAAGGDRGVTVDVDAAFLAGEYKSAKYQRKMITKFNESDLQFFSRVCEHYGIFYYFDFSDDGTQVRDKVILGWKNENFAPADGTTLYRKATTTTDIVPAVTGLSGVFTPPLRSYSLDDYNYEAATSELMVSSNASGSGGATGIGVVVDYGDNYASVDEGQNLVYIRAAEEAWQSRVFDGTSTLASLRTGMLIDLAEHPVDKYCGKYVVLSARHEAGKCGPDGYVYNVEKQNYRNTFGAIRSDTPFRPKRVTPRPVMTGVFNAVVEAEDTGAKRPVLDSSGRYRIGLQYNGGDTRQQPGKGSAPTRQVQPYAGAAANKVVSGLHLPLTQQAEVLVSYENGDPDRPVILGAAFNSRNADPVTASSQTLNCLRTAGGLLLAMEDGQTDTDPRYIRFDVPTKVDDQVPSGDYLRLGAFVDGDAKVQSGVEYSTSTVSQQDNSNPYKGPNEKASSSKTSETKSKVNATKKEVSGKGFLLYTESDLDMNIKGAAVMKVASGQATQVTDGDITQEVDKGQFTVSALNGVTITAGKAGGAESMADITITATNTVTTKSGGDTYDWIYGKSTKYTMGESFTMFLGLEQTIKAAQSTTVQLSGVLGITIGINASVLAGMSTSMTVGAKWDMIIGSSAKLVMGSGDMKITASDMKITKSDLKMVAGTDFKMVEGMDGKLVNIAFESVKVKKTMDNITLDEAQMVFKQVDLIAERASMKSNFVKLQMFL